MSCIWWTVGAILLTLIGGLFWMTYSLFSRPDLNNIDYEEDLYYPYGRGDEQRREE